MVQRSHRKGYTGTMKRILEAADRLHDKMPYLLQDSPLDPAFLVCLLPFFLGYVAVILLANLL